jgi:hypothetical protein
MEENICEIRSNCRSIYRVERQNLIFLIINLNYKGIYRVGDKF